MARRLPCLPALALSVPLLFGAALARADDWPQFRHDERRTGASEDRLALPLTDIWSTRRLTTVTDKKKDGRKEVVIWKGRIFYVITEPKSRRLICGDLRTGERLWQQELAPLEVGADNKERPTNRPRATGYSATWLGVSEAGLVYAYDLRAVLPTMRNYRGGLQWCVVAFSARDGSLHDYYAIYSAGPEDPRFAYDTVTRLFLLHGLPGQYADGQIYWKPNIPQPPYPSRYLRTGFWGIGYASEGLGAPLINRVELMALGRQDLFFRWAPGRPGQHIRLIHPYSQMPAPPPEHWHPDYIPQTHFLGYPMAMSAAGVVLGDDRGFRFLAVIDPNAPDGRHLRWHRDWQWCMGVPATDERHVFLGGGGLFATDCVFALEAQTGASRWVYPPIGAAPDVLDKQYALITWPDENTSVGRVAPGRPGGGSTRAGTLRGPSLGPRGNPRPVRAGSRPQAARAVDPDETAPLLHTQVVFTYQGGGTYARNPGLVLVKDRIYGIVRTKVTALEKDTGKVLWELPLRIDEPATYLVASRDHLILCQQAPKTIRKGARITALRLKDGKEMWSREVSEPGGLALAHGLLVFSDGEFVHTLAPAERVSAMAVDSDRPEDYRPIRVEPEGVQCGQATPNAAEAKPAPAPAGPQEAVADATVLRLHWGDSLEEMVRKARARRQAAPGLPLLLVMDWLDPSRSKARLAGADGGWSPDQARAFAQGCALLAAQVRPEHFDLAPEVNVYLARRPDRLAAVRQLVGEAAQAVHLASGSTRTLVSFNAEVFSGRYGKGRYFPFGAADQIGSPDPRHLPALAELVQEVGVTTYPLAGWGKAEDVPGNHLLKIRQAIPTKPLVVSRMAAALDPKHPTPEADQAVWMKRMLQLCYWLDSPLIAYSDIDGRREDGEGALRKKGQERPALLMWRDTLAWKRVRKLTARLSGGSVEPAELPEEKEGEGQ